MNMKFIRMHFLTSVHLLLNKRFFHVASFKSKLSVASEISHHILENAPIEVTSDVLKDI